MKRFIDQKIIIASETAPGNGEIVGVIVKDDGDGVTLRIQHRKEYLEVELGEVALFDLELSLSRITRRISDVAPKKRKEEFCEVLEDLGRRIAAANEKGDANL